MVSGRSQGSQSFFFRKIVPTQMFLSIGNRRCHLNRERELTKIAIFITRGLINRINYYYLFTIGKNVNYSRLKPIRYLFRQDFIRKSPGE